MVHGQIVDDFVFYCYKTKISREEGHLLIHLTPFLTNDLLVAVQCDVAIIIMQGIITYVSGLAVFLIIARFLKIVRAPS